MKDPPPAPPLSDEEKRVARQVAEALIDLIGEVSGAKVVEQGMEVSVPKLMKAILTGDNPLPALQSPRKVSPAKILLTPDISQSCRGWISSFVLFAEAIKADERFHGEVVCNANGLVMSEEEGEMADKPIGKLVAEERYDVVLYIGDDDADWALAKTFSKTSASVIALKDAWREKWEHGGHRPRDLKVEKNARKGNFLIFGKGYAPKSRGWVRLIREAVRRVKRG